MVNASSEDDSSKWLPIAAEQLKTLMLFLTKGVWGLPLELQSPDLPYLKPVSQRQLAAELNVTQGTVSDWKRGKLIRRQSQIKLATFCNRPLDRLDKYLAGEITHTEFWEEELLKGLPESLFNQILDLLPRFRPQQRAQLMYHCLDSWVQESDLLTVNAREEQPISLTWLIFKELLKPGRPWNQSVVPVLILLQMSGISLNQLGLIFTGRSLSPQIIEGLSQVLTKDLLGEANWTIEELTEIAHWTADEMSDRQGDTPDVWQTLDSDAILTIASLIDLELKNRGDKAIEQLAEVTGIDTDRLMVLKAGLFPTSSELCDLALGLRKYPHSCWNEEELRQIRQAQFGQPVNAESQPQDRGQSDVKSDAQPQINGQPNGATS